MAENIDQKNIDKRTLNRRLNSGQLDEKSYERYLKSLPDLTELAAPIETLMEDDEDTAADDEPTHG
jgi:hypothetical protein